MTTMPDLSSTLAAYAPSTLGAPTVRRASATPKPDVAEAIRPEQTRSTASAETQRLSAERYELETQAQTTAGVVEALRDTRRAVEPQLANLRRLYESKSVDSTSPTATEQADAAAAEKAEVTASLASRTRASAARLAAMRLAAQTQATREADAARAEAEELASLNSEVLDTPDMPDTRRAAVARRQRDLADSLAERLGAVSQEEPDGTVSARIGGRDLVRGSDVTHLSVTAEPASDAGPESVTPGDDAGTFDPDATDGASAPAQSTTAGTSPTGATTTREGAPAPAPAVAGRPVDTAAAGTTAPPAGPTVTDPDAVSSLADLAEIPPLQATWPDGEPAEVGGKLAGLLAADRNGIVPAIRALDDVAASISAFVNGAQAQGTTPDGAPGAPLLTGDDAMSLSVVPGSVPVASTSAGPATGPTPEDLLGLAETQARTQVATLERRAGVVAGFDSALGDASTRIGRHVSAALGAIDGATSGEVVTALQQANSAMAFAGSVAEKATAAGIPVLVGSSDPSVATGTGTLPLDAALEPIVRVDVLSVAGVVGGSDTTAAAGAAGVVAGAVPGQPGPAVGVAPTDLAGTTPGLSSATPATPATAGPGGPAGPDVPSLAVPPMTPAEGVMVSPGVEGDIGPATGVEVPAAGPTTGAPAATTSPEATGIPGTAAGSVAGAPGSGIIGRGGSVADLPVFPVASGAGPVPAPGNAAGTADGAAGPAPATATAPSGVPTGWSAALVGGRMVSSPTATLTGVLPGIDLQLKAPGTVTLSVSPDPAPALERVQTLVDAVGRVASAAGATAATAPATASAPAGLVGKVASLWSSLSSPATATPAASSPVADVLGAVAAPLAAEVSGAFVGPDGRPTIPGISVERGRVSLQREVFAREYVQDAPAVEAQIASVARQVSATADASTDPRIGALAVRIAAEMRLDAEYTLDGTAGQEQLDARQDVLDRKAVGLQSLLERLSEQSSWLGNQLQG